MFSKNSILMLACAMFLVAGGCAPKFVGKGTGVYSGNKLYAVTSSDMSKVYESTLQSMNDLGIEIVEKSHDVFEGKVVAKGADGTRITVIMTPTSAGTTEYSVQVGTFGEMERSRIIFERIKKNLGE